MLSRFSLCRVSLCFALAALSSLLPYSAEAAAPKAADAAATVGQESTLLNETFSSAPAAAWRKAKGRWEIVDGAWQGAELPADKHGAVVRHDLKFTDAVIEFDFKLDGARSISLSINDPKGHNSRLAITPTSFRLTKDDHDHAGPDKAAVLGGGPAKFEPGRWYHARIVQTGDAFSAQVGDYTAAGKHEAIAVAKSNIGLTVAGESASFKNLKVTVPASK